MGRREAHQGGPEIGGASWGVRRTCPGSAAWWLLGQTLHLAASEVGAQDDPGQGVPPWALPMGLDAWLSVQVRAFLELKATYTDWQLTLAIT